MVVRAYEARDEAAVVDLWDEVFGYTEARNAPARVVHDKVELGDELLLVAEDAGASLVGTLMAGYDGHRGWLYRLAVAPSARRRGLARELVVEAERRLRALGCAKINLQTHAGNESGIAFWQSVGYHVEQRVSMGKDITGDPTANEGDPGC